MNRDDVEAWLALAREDGSAASQGRLLGRVASASALGLVLASSRAALALEMKLALTGTLAPWAIGFTQAGVVGGVVGAVAAAAAPPLSVVATVAEPLAAETEAGSVRVEVRPGTGAPSTEDVSGVEAPREPSMVPRPIETADPRTTRVIPSRAAAGEQRSPAPSTPTAPTRRDPFSDITPRRPDLAPALAVLDRARRAIAAADGAAALSALEAYPDHRGDGTLDPEARLLRIVATRLAGRPDAAANDARVWLREEPHTPFNEALRAVIEESP
ncbi:MAG: hypothetical protein AAF928_07570 [Myxococcota bacterium]